MFVATSDGVDNGSNGARATSRPACVTPTPAPVRKNCLPAVAAAPPKGKATKLIGSNTPAPKLAQNDESAKTCLRFLFSSSCILRSRI